VVETAERGKVNFITDMIYQPANEVDRDVLEQLTTDIEQLGLKPGKLYVDSGYISAEMIKSFRDRGQELMGYMPGYGGREKAFQTEAFAIDIEKEVAICPAGHQNTTVGHWKNGNVVFYFDGDTCRKCRFFQQCVRATSKTATKRRLMLRPYYAYRRERRRIQETEAFQHEMRVRAQVEGTISEATRMHGLRYARYRGDGGHQLQFYMTGAAINVRRLERAFAKEKQATRR
jgi:hypothetical protein